MTGASPSGVIWGLTGRLAPSFRSDEVDSKTCFSRPSRRVTDKAHHGLLVNRNDHDRVRLLVFGFSQLLTLRTRRANAPAARVRRLILFHKLGLIARPPLRNSNQKSGCIGEIRARCGLIISSFPGKLVLTPYWRGRQHSVALSRVGVSPERAPPNPLPAGLTVNEGSFTQTKRLFSETSLCDFRSRIMKASAKPMPGRLQLCGIRKAPRAPFFLIVAAVSGIRFLLQGTPRRGGRRTT